jgi:hypothetical protein
LTSGQLALRSVEARTEAGSRTQTIDQCPTPAVDLANCLRIRDGSARLLATLSIELVQFIELAQESSYLDLAFGALRTVAGIHPHHLLRPMDPGPIWAVPAVILGLRPAWYQRSRVRGSEHSMSMTAHVSARSSSPDLASSVTLSGAHQSALGAADLPSDWCGLESVGHRTEAMSHGPPRDGEA